MTPPADAAYRAPENSVYRSNLSVETVAGGSDTNPLWMSKVDSESFKDALTQSLSDAGYISKNGSSNYQLHANLLKLDQPYFGASFDVVSTVNYTIENMSTHKISYDETFTKTGTAKFGDSLIGVERLRLANENSMRNNLEAFLVDLKSKSRSTAKPSM